tara:strand:- start:1780 stop:2037 length:258 start_codon:yes stop_codon:yes gene_type:complete
MITNIIRLLLFAIIIVAFICFYESDYVIKESMQTKEKNDSDAGDRVADTTNPSDNLKSWLKEEGKDLYEDISRSTSTKITDLAFN